MRADETPASPAPIVRLRDARLHYAIADILSVVRESKNDRWVRNR
jgi:hypothetical protein